MSRMMKETSVSWIGEIPSDWKIERVKHGFTRKKEEAHLEEPVVLSLARSGVKIRDLSHNEGQIAESYYNYNPVEDGDLLLNPMDLVSGANCSISHVSGVISPAYMNLRHKDGYDPLYYDYYFKAQYWSMAMFAHGKGVSFENRWTLGAEDLLNYYIPVPKYEEQCRISKYIDTQCRRIDNVIQKTSDSIEEYKRLKQSIITNAVTKGIRPNREFKNSGYDAVGEIPSDWDAMKFGLCIEVKSNLVDPSLYPNYLQIAPDNIEKGAARLTGEIRTVEETGVISWNHLFYEGQIIYSKIRPMLNKLVIAPFDGLCSADMYPIETTLNKGYIVYLMLSDIFLNQVGLVTMDRVKMPKINQNELSNIKIPVPSDEEQKEIAEYLDDKCEKLDLLIDKKNELVQQLEEYKRSLVYEYVTGKKEVPACY